MMKNTQTLSKKNPKNPTKTTSLPKTLRGGKREGAGRPTGSGKYGESTKAIRIPESLVEDVRQFLIHYEYEKAPSQLIQMFKATLAQTSLPLPLYDHQTIASSSPASDHIGTQLDLNQHLVPNPTSTFFVQVEESSTPHTGIHSKYLLVIDRSLSPQNGNVVAATVNHQFTLKRLEISQTAQKWLISDNEKEAPLLVEDGMDCHILGVVTHRIHFF